MKVFFCGIFSLVFIGSVLNANAENPTGNQQSMLHYRLYRAIAIHDVDQVGSLLQQGAKPQARISRVWGEVRGSGKTLLEFAQDLYDDVSSGNRALCRIFSRYQLLYEGCANKIVDLLDIYAQRETEG